MSSLQVCFALKNFEVTWRHRSSEMFCFLVKTTIKCHLFLIFCNSPVRHGKIFKLLSTSDTKDVSHPYPLRLSLFKLKVPVEQICILYPVLNFVMHGGSYIYSSLPGTVIDKICFVFSVLGSHV